MKIYFYSLIMCLLMCISANADTYMVSAKNGLNVRESATSTSTIIGKLDYKEQVNVTSEEGDWVKIAWNGKDAYISKQYIVPQGEIKKQNVSILHGISRWLFSFDWTFWSCVKWLFIIVIGIVVAHFCLGILCYILGGGLWGWGITLLVCVVLWFFRIIESETIWRASKWGFDIGLVGGVICVVCNFREVVSDVLSGVDSSGACNSPGYGGNSSSSEDKGACDSPKTAYGQYGMLTPGGDGIYLEDGRIVWVYDVLEDGRLQDQNGQLWEKNGNNVRRV